MVNYDLHIEHSHLEDAVFKYKKSSKVSLSTFLNDKMTVIKAINAGIPYTLFESFAEKTPLSLRDWSTVLNLSDKSLQRYKQNNTRFKPIHTEKIIEIAEVSLIGNRVFGDSHRFKLWIESPCYALGSMRPLELLSNSYGKELVLTELIRIEHGILA